MCRESYQSHTNSTTDTTVSSLGIDEIYMVLQAFGSFWTPGCEYIPRCFFSGQKLTTCTSERWFPTPLVNALNNCVQSQHNSLVLSVSSTQHAPWIVLPWVNYFNTVPRPFGDKRLSGITTTCGSQDLTIDSVP